MQNSNKKLNLLSDFDFDLSKELIAQVPATQRDHSSLLILNKQKIHRTLFHHIIDYLQENDVIIFNNSRVIKAKLILSKPGWGKGVELYLNKELHKDIWHGFTKPARKLQEQDIFDFGGHKIIIVKKLEMGQVEIRFKLDNLSLFKFLEHYGQIPLPPYIKRESINPEDDLRYQTIFNQVDGSVAAPTASLHFTEELLKKIKAKNIQIEYLTLHVGAGTFLPIKVNDISEHKMHSEYYHIGHETAININKAIKEKKRIIAVGTTVLRALESAYINDNLRPGEFETAIFIKPGFKFNVSNMLLTNFHLPKSSLFILACAFAGYNEIKTIYNFAIKEKMRFFSYGDAMLLTLKES